MPEYKHEDSRAKWVRCRSWDQVRAELKALLKKEPDRIGFYVRTNSHRGDESPADRHHQTKALFKQEGQTIESKPTEAAPEAVQVKPTVAVAGPKVAEPTGAEAETGPASTQAREEPTPSEKANLSEQDGSRKKRGQRGQVSKAKAPSRPRGGRPETAQPSSTRPQPASASTSRPEEIPRLVGLVGSFEGQRLQIERVPVVLGRDSGCEVVIDNPFLSRRHAKFDWDDSGCMVVRDLDSSEGTYVNGSRIDSSPLHHGDVVGFGHGGLLGFRFEIGSDRESDDPESQNSSSVEALRAKLQSAGATSLNTQSRHVPVAVSQTPVAPASNPDLVRIGRAPDNDMVLGSPSVSRYHAQIDYATGTPRIADVGSLNGTFVNGEPVQEARALASTDIVFLGGFLLRVSGREVSSHDLSSSRLTVSRVTQAYGDKTVLHEVSFAIFPREFVGIMGPSGCGKSTLMDALNGLRPAKSGNVFINELDLYQNFDAVRRSIGYVPQRDILHNELTVRRTLHYAALLRLPEKTSRKAAQHTINEVIGLVGLTEQKDTAFKQLSGGQQKRLSLAVELLTKPSFLFLDEPTSPLDPETSENLMMLFRQLADEGRILVMVTHKFEKFEQMHQIVLLTKGGHLAYFGPPTEALRYFDCEQPSGLYRKVGAQEPHEVGQAFRASKAFQSNIAKRLQESEHAVSAAQRVGTSGTRGPSGESAWSKLRQWGILTHRYLDIKLKDKRNTLILIGQAPLIAVILAAITSGTVNDAKTLFIGAVIAVWFGGNNAIREIVAELPIYKRERLVNLKIWPYLWSKFTVLGVIAIVQCFLFVATLVSFGSLQEEDTNWIVATLSLTAIGGVSLGLLCSAVVNSTEKAMSVLPLILIPQLLLSGFMKPLDDYYVNAVTSAPATREEYQKYEEFRTADKSKIPRSRRARFVPPDPVTMVEGLGGAKFASVLILARWSVDALVHSVGREDEETRDRLAGRFFVTAYEQVWEGGSPEEIADEFRFHAYLNWLAILLTIAANLKLAAMALKKKDSL